MDKNGLRRNILRVLYECEEQNPDRVVNAGHLLEALKIKDKKILLSNLNYLHGKGYVKLKKLPQTFFSEITAKGIDLIEDPNEFNSKFPISLTQNIVKNSPGTVINSSNVSINIEESFNQIYKELDEKNPVNKQEIEDIIKSLKKELGKEEINKSKVRKCYNWLNNNVSWIIPMISQIILATFTGK